MAKLCDIKAGCRVRFREWDDMAKEFGVSFGSITCRFSFPREMRPLCGCEATVAKIDDGMLRLVDFDGTIEGRNCWMANPWSVSPDMVELISGITEYDDVEFERMLGGGCQ